MEVLDRLFHTLASQVGLPVKDQELWNSQWLFEEDVQGVHMQGSGHVDKIVIDSFLLTC